jgi:hypothetical protein
MPPSFIWHYFIPIEPDWQAQNYTYNIPPPIHHQNPQNNAFWVIVIT